MHILIRKQIIFKGGFTMKQIGKKQRILVTTIIALILVLTSSFAFASGAEGETPNFGILSLLPPLVAIALAIITKEVIASLFIGMWVAGTMLALGNPISGFGKSVEFLWNSLGDPWSARIALTSLVLGGLVGVMRTGGGIEAAIKWITKRIKSAKGALFATELAGFIIFFEDYVNWLFAGLNPNCTTPQEQIVDYRRVVNSLQWDPYSLSQIEWTEFPIIQMGAYRLASPYHCNIEKVKNSLLKLDSSIRSWVAISLIDIKGFDRNY